MKKILSIVVLILCNFLSIVVIALASSAILALIQTIYSSSKAIFWVILFLGGSFGLGIFWWLVPMLVALVIDRSQKICLSKRGTRYLVVGSLTIILYALNTVSAIVHSAPNKATLIVTSILIIIYSIALIVMGKETAIAEYVEPVSSSIPADDLNKLKELFEAGVITEEDFQNKKKQLLRL